MNRSEENYGVAVLRGLCAVLCSAMLLFVMKTQAQSQTLLTRHVREAVSAARRSPSGGSPQPSPCASTSFWRCAISQSWKISCKSSTILPVPPTGTSSRSEEFTARFGPSQEDYDAVIRFAKANGFTVVGGSRDAMDVQTRGLGGEHRESLPRDHGRLPAPHGKPHILCSGPRAHGGPAVPAVARLGFGQLFDPASRYMHRNLEREVQCREGLLSRRLLIAAATCGRPTTAERLSPAPARTSGCWSSPDTISPT